MNVNKVSKNPRSSLRGRVRNKLTNVFKKFAPLVAAVGIGLSGCGDPAVNSNIVPDSGVERDRIVRVDASREKDVDVPDAIIDSTVDSSADVGFVDSSVDASVDWHCAPADDFTYHLTLDIYIERDQNNDIENLYYYGEEWPFSVRLWVIKDGEEVYRDFRELTGECLHGIGCYEFNYVEVYCGKGQYEQERIVTHAAQYTDGSWNSVEPPFVHDYTQHIFGTGWNLSGFDTPYPPTIEVIIHTDVTPQ